MLTIILFLFKVVSGVLLLAAFVSLISNPWDFGGSSETPRSKPDEKDDDFILYMDDEDD